MSENYFVAPRGESWEVKRERDRAVASVHRTRREAIKHARELARESRGRLIVPRQAGRTAPKSISDRATGHAGDDHVGAFEAKTHFARLLQRVENGDEIIITRHGSPIARMVPVKKQATASERRDAIARWRKILPGVTLGGGRAKDLVDEGRP